MFGYEYVNLNDEQIKVRRRLLDNAGVQAYLAPIILLFAVWTYRNLKRTKRSVSTYDKGSSGIGLLSYRVSWILDNTYISEFGPLNVQLLGLIYTAFLLWRIAYQTSNDYMHVTKALGHVAVSQLPMHYLLSIKSPSSPVTLATGLTHERLNAYHRLFGRIIHALLATHAILYLRFFAALNLLPKRLNDSDVRLGIIAFWTVNFLGILSIPPIRAKAYHVLFYRSHIILSALLLLVLWFHVKYTRIYVAQAAVIWLLNGVLRKAASQTAQVKCENGGKDLIHIKVKTQNTRFCLYLPGVHVYLNKGGLGPRTPFTVLSTHSLTKQETEVELVARNSGGAMTNFLGTAATHGHSVQLQLEGPYGEAQIHMPDLLEPKTVAKGSFLLVAGGVGATYSLPIYKALVNARGSVDGIKLLWVVRDEDEMTWAKRFLSDDSLTSGINVAITQPRKPHQSEPGAIGGGALNITIGRPNLAEFVDGFFGETLSEKERNLHAQRQDHVTIMVCGPRGLSISLRKAVGKHVMSHGIHVNWYEEQYGFGGS